MTCALCQKDHQPGTPCRLGPDQALRTALRAPERAQEARREPGPCPGCLERDEAIQELRGRLSAAMELAEKAKAPVITGTCAREGCDEPVSGRKIYCSARCRVAANRAQKRQADQEQTNADSNREQSRTGN